MKRYPAHAIAKRRQLATVHEAESREQRQRSLDVVLPRPLKPLEAAWVGSPRDHFQHGRRQIDPADLRLTMRPQPIVRIPQTPHDAGAKPRRSTRTLLGRVRRDPLEIEAVDRALGVVSRDLLQA